jgi:hypothetical protein
MLEQGEAYVVANEASDPMYRTRPQKIKIRPTAAMPTGTTEKAVSDAEWAKDKQNKDKDPGR